MERVLRAKDKKITVVGETVDLGDMVDKIDEMVAWINNYNKQWAKFWLEVTESPDFEDLKKRVDKINDWVLEHEQARGEHDPK